MANNIENLKPVRSKEEARKRRQRRTGENLESQGEKKLLLKIN